MIATLEDALAYLNIHDVLAAFTEALDTRDWARFDDIYTGDVLYNFYTSAASRDAGTPEFSSVGLRQTVALHERFFATLSQTHHFLGNCRVRTEGDEGFVSAHMRAYHRGTGSVAHLFEESLSTFTAELVRDSARWRIRRFDYTALVILGSMDVFSEA